MKNLLHRALAVGVLLLVDQRSIGAHESATVPGASDNRVLVFSGTGWFRHPEIPANNGWLVRLGAASGFQVDITETAKDITPQRLAQYRVLVMNNCNELDKVFDEKQRATIEEWYKKGHGIVALHAALVHQQKWPWLHELAGCDFDSDSDFLEARIVVDPAAKDHPTVRGHGASFMYKADWTNHTRSVTGLPGVQVLLRVDESTYVPVRPYFVQRNGKAMGADHPIAWTREWEGGRFFYTELGHSLSSLQTPFGEQHVREAIRWAAGGANPAAAK